MRCPLGVLIALAALALLAFGAIAEGASASNSVPNGNFAKGLVGWLLAAPPSGIKLVRVKLPEAKMAVWIDGTGACREAGIASQDFPIEGNRRYEVSAWVKPVAGSGAYKVACEWLDAEHKHLGYANSWTGVLVGHDWEHHQARVTPAAGAKYARILAGVRSGCVALMTDFRLDALDEAAEAGTQLALDLFCDQADQAGRPWQLCLRMENLGMSSLSDLHGQIHLPEGLSAKETSFHLAHLACAESHTFGFEVTGWPKLLSQRIRCTVTAMQAGHSASFTTATRPFVTSASPRVTPTSQLAPPVAPRNKVKLGCYYFPVMLDWDRNGWGVRKVDYLNPLLGYYNEASPEVADWHIKWAVEHGISYFVFDWYFNQGLYYLNDALEKGFLKSRFSNDMEFCIDWCNEGQCTEFKPLDFSDATLEQFIRYAAGHYFSKSNYLRVDGKPVVLIHNSWRIANAHGGWLGCAAALDRMRHIAAGYGEPGVYFVAVQNNPELLPFGKGGFDCVTAYSYGFGEVTWTENRSVSYPALLPQHRKAYKTARERAHEQGLAYIPTAWVGWDDNARTKEKSVRTVGNTPAAFRRALEALPDFVEPSTRLALFESWNEWGEGGAAEPGTPYGFGYLEAVRDALTDARGPYQVPVPTAADTAGFQTSLTCEQLNHLYWRRYAATLRPGWLKHGLQMEFNSLHSLWFKPVAYTAGVKIAGGALQGQSTGNDPSLIGPPVLDLPTAASQSVRLGLSVSAGEWGQLFWLCNGQSDFTDAHSVKFKLQADGKMHEYVLDLAHKAGFEGTIERFRFDPMDAPGSFALDYFRTVPREPAGTPHSSAATSHPVTP